MRSPQPNWRKARKAWVCRIDGQLYTLAKGKDKKKEAKDRLQEILDEQKGKAKAINPAIPFGQLADLFLEWCQREKEKSTYDWYVYILSGFSSLKKSKRARDLIPQDLEDWFTQGKQKFSSGTRSRAIEAVIRVLNWGKKQKIIRENPLQGMDRPAKPRREIFVNQEQRTAIVACYAEGDPFRDFLFAMEQTGCRPGEVAKLTSEQVSLTHGLWILTKHKMKNKTGRARIIYLSDPMIELTKRLMEQVPAGTPLFRNSEGNPWTKNAVRLRLTRVRKKLKIPGLVSYLWRHGFITQALERGISDAVVAALAGHADTRIIHQHYSHLTENAKLLRAAANRAVG